MMFANHCFEWTIAKLIRLLSLGLHILYKSIKEFQEIQAVNSKNISELAAKMKADQIK